MKKAEQKTTIALMALFSSLFIIHFSFAGSTATFTARCYMPEMVSTEKIETNVPATKEATIEIRQKKDDTVSKENKNIFQKTEEIISESTKETQIITTVCAK